MRGALLVLHLISSSVLLLPSRLFYPIFPSLCRLSPVQLRRAVLGFTGLMEGEATLGQLAGEVGVTEEMLKQVLLLLLTLLILLIILLVLIIKTSWF